MGEVEFMNDIIFVITSNSEETNEWKEWVKEGTNETHIKIDKNGKKTDGENDVLLICFNRKGNNFIQDFDNLYLKLQNSNRSTYTVFHGTKRQFDIFLLSLNHEIKEKIKDENKKEKDKYPFYTYANAQLDDALIGNKVLKPLANAVCDGKSELFNDRFGWLLKLCKQETTIDKVPWSWVTTTIKVLRSFLPLDIDMQALTDKKVDKEKYLQEMAKDLDELYSSKEKRNIHYRRKLYDLMYLLGQKEWFVQSGLEYSSELENFAPIEKPKLELCEFAGINSGEPNLLFPIYKFLESLDKGNIQTKDKNITTFHEWYIKLCEYLKKDEV